MSDTRNPIAEFAQTRYLAEEKTLELLAFLRDLNWREEEVQNVMTTYWCEPKAIRAYSDLIVDNRLKGLDVNDVGFRKDFETETRIQYNMNLASFDPLTRLAAQNAFNKPLGGTLFRYYSPAFFLDPFVDWRFATIIGLPGSGKSDWAGKMTEMALADGRFGVVTNIKVLNPPNGLFFCRSLRKALMKCIENMFSGKVATILILDELSQFVNVYRYMSKDAVDFGKVNNLFRKVDGREIVIAQLEGDVGRQIRSFAEVEFQKESKGRLIYKKFYDNKRETHIIQGVERTTLQYDHRDPASFDVDVDMDDFNEYIASLEENAPVIESIYDYLNKNGQPLKDKITDKDINTFIKVGYLRGKKQKDIGKDLGITQQAVSYRIEKLRDAGVVT